MTKRHSESALGSDVQHLRYVAAILAIVVAGIHLLHPQFGGSRLVLYLQAGALFDPRPLVFTVSAFLIVFGILLAYHGLWIRRVYVGGILLMVTYLIGFVAWHTVLGHGAFWPYIVAHGHSDTGLIETVWTHFASDMVVMVSKIHEAALLVVLAVLYLKDTPSAIEG